MHHCYDIQYLNLLTLSKRFWIAKIDFSVCICHSYSINKHIERDEEEVRICHQKSKCPPHGILKVYVGLLLNYDSIL